MEKMLQTITEKMDGFNKALADIQSKVEEKNVQAQRQGVADPITREELKRLHEQADRMEQKYTEAIEEQKKQAQAIHSSLQEVMEQKRAATAAEKSQLPGLEAIPALIRGMAHGDWGREREYKSLLKHMRYAGDGPDRGKAILADELSTTYGSYLIPETWSNQMIPMIYNATIFNKLPTVKYQPTGGTVRFPKMSSGATAYMVGSTTAITTSAPIFTQANMEPHKIGVLCPVDNQLVRRADPMVEQILREDMMKVAGLKLEDQFLTGTGGDPNIDGLDIQSGIQNILMASPDGAKFTASNNIDKLMQLPRYVEAAGGIFEAWIMAARTKWDLREVKDTTGHYLLTLATNAGDPPLLLGYPYHITNAISTAQTVGAKSDCSTIYGGQWSNVVTAIWTGMEIVASKEGSYAVSGTTYSCLQEDTCAFRLILEADVLYRQPTTIGKIRGIRPNDGA